MSHNDITLTHSFQYAFLSGEKEMKSQANNQYKSQDLLITWGLSYLPQWISNFSVHQNPLEGLLRHKLLGLTRSFWFSRSEVGLRIHISNKLMLMLQFEESHFDNHCFPPTNIGISWWCAINHFCHYTYHSVLYSSSKWFWGEEWSSKSVSAHRSTPLSWTLSTIEGDRYRADHHCSRSIIYAPGF